VWIQSHSFSGTKKTNEPKGFIINRVWDGGYYREDKYRFPPVKWGPNRDDHGDKRTLPSMCRGLYFNGGL